MARCVVPLHVVPLLLLLLVMVVMMVVVVPMCCLLRCCLLPHLLILCPVWSHLLLDSLPVHDTQ